MNATDIGLLIAGALLGGLVGVLFTVLFQPFLEDSFRPFLAAMFSRTSQGRRETLDGEWSARWWNDTNRTTPEDQEYTLRVHQIGNSVTGLFGWGHTKDDKREYIFKGKIENNTFLTGTYYDKRPGRVFFGVFQLQIYPNTRTLLGKWAGFNASNTIISGTWEWRRSGSEPYPSERQGTAQQQIAQFTAGEPQLP